MNKHIQFHTTSAIFSLPQITDYIASSANNPSYISRGKHRKSETHCIFHYTVSGSGETWIGDHVYRTTPGYGFLNVINDASSGYRYYRNDGEDWNFIVICFDFGNVRALTYELIEHFGPIFHIENSSVFDEIAAYEDDRNIVKISAEENYQLFVKLLQQLLRNAKKHQSVEHSNIIDTAKNYIAANLSNNISITEISETLHVSREHLSRVFKSQTNESLKQYIDTQRMHYIAQLLSLPELSIQQVAEKTSFSSVSNFSSFVKKHSQKTPREFKNHKK